MGLHDDFDVNNAPSIPEYYKGKTIFITGATGFMGNVLLEKLLRSCSELERVYVLLRPKRGVAMQERLKKMFANQLYDQLKTEQPGVFESKVVAVAGDVANDNLGLSKEDWARLTSEVHIIFHAAASVRFDDSLKQAVKMNLTSAVDIVQLAKETRKLEALVHVSTAFANVIYGECVEEKMYPPYADWRETISICEDLDDNTVDVFTSKYICGLPNTYVFTKQLAEHVMYEERGKLPLVIIRPTLVSSMMNDPVPGWHNTMNGIAGMFIAVAKGVLSTVKAKNVEQDYIPVDLCARLFIAAAWYRGIRTLKPTDGVEIYHCSSNSEEPLKLYEVFQKGLRATENYSAGVSLGYPTLSLDTGVVYYLKFLFKQLFFAFIVDTCLWVAGKKPILTKIQRKVYKTLVALSYFMTHEWTFRNENMVSLRSLIKEEDIEQFRYDTEEMFEQDYMENAVLGGRRFLLKLSDENLPKERLYFKMHKMLHYAFYTVVYCYLAWKVLKVMNVVESVQSIL